MGAMVESGGTTIAASSAESAATKRTVSVQSLLDPRMVTVCSSIISVLLFMQRRLVVQLVNKKIKSLYPIFHLSSSFRHLTSPQSMDDRGDSDEAFSCITKEDDDV